MAYTMTSGTATNTAAFFLILRTWFETTMGFSIHDNQLGAGTPYLVYRSTGESGNDEWYPVLAECPSADLLGLKFCSYWDNSSQTEYGQPLSIFAFTSANLKVDDDTQFLYWLYGDKDGITIVTKLNTGLYYVHFVGKIDTAYTEDIAITSGNVTSGPGKVITVDDSSYFTVGNHYIIGNTNAVDGLPERILVTAKDTIGTDITADLVAAHDSGARVGIDIFPYFLNYQGGKTAYSWGCRGTGTEGLITFVNQNKDLFTAISPAGGGDPNERIDLYQLWPYLIYETAAGQREYWGTVKRTYVVGADGLTSEDTITVGGQVYKYFLGQGQVGVGILEA